MNPACYEFLSDYLYRQSGLALGPSKEYLLEARLKPVARSIGLETVEELVERLQGGGSDAALQTAVTEAMTTNETSFFRDGVPFEEFREQLLPRMVQSRGQTRRLRIWCAASSTGQEPYSIAMLLEDHFPELKDWLVEIVATDISTVVLEQAKSGVYSQLEVQRGLPIKTLLRHFEQVGADWRLKEPLRRRVRFQQLNLLEPFEHLGRFDVVFCRNVLIYFDTETKKSILDRTSRLLSDDGALFLGAAETILGVTDVFQRDLGYRSGVHVKRESGSGETPAAVGLAAAARP